MTAPNLYILFIKDQPVAVARTPFTPPEYGNPDDVTILEYTLATTPTPTQSRCTECNYQHGHMIGCKNNPVDIALKETKNDT